MSKTDSALDALPSDTRTRVVWAFVWRGLIINLCGALAGGVAGFILSLSAAFIASVAFGERLSPGSAKIIGGVAGFAAGMVLCWVYVRWLFRANLAGFRLSLTPAGSNPPAGAGENAA